MRALSETLGKTLPYDTPMQLHARIFEEWPHLGQLDEIAAAPALKAGKVGKLNKAAFKNPVRNFYMTNAICRASDTMRACAERLRSPEQPMLEAAE